VFSGFVFAGAGQYRGDGHADDGPSEGETSAVRLPTRPAVGVEYVFHHKRPVSDENLALIEFPSRLARAGIAITRSPASSRDMMYVYVGGPLFEIHVKDGYHEGIVFNRMDRRLLQTPRTEWVPEDYVIVWTK
jgi:hypothetical protein